jgi:hypothetical protein
MHDTHPYVPSKPLYQLPGFREALQKLWDEHDRKQLAKGRKKKAKGNESLSKYAHKLLTAWGLHQYWPVARLWDGLDKPSPSVQKAVREELEKERELAEFEEVRISKRNMLFLMPTEAGWAYLKTDPPKRKGRGGIAHTHFCEFIRMVGEKRGHKAMIEWNVPGTNHPVDAVWFVNGEAHAFEVIVESRDNLISHLEACFIRSTEVATVTVITIQKKLAAKYVEQVDLAVHLMPFRPRIHFDTVSTFIGELWP